MKLSVGFSTRNDYHGAWMTIETLLEFHYDVTDQIVVIDNSPENSKHAKELEDCCKGQVKVKYVKAVGPESSCIYKNRVFTESECEYAACCDSHVIFKRGAIAALREFWLSREHERDMASGPCYSRHGVIIGTNQMTYASEPYAVPKDAHVCGETVWRGGAMGVWVRDERKEPFEITQQGTGFFSMRRDSWPGFLPEFVGHGGNETYLYERVRQLGGKTWCLPAAGWIHRFGRPDGVPYQVKWEPRIANYLRGFKALGRQDLVDAATQHFHKLCPATLQRVTNAKPAIAKPGSQTAIKPKQPASKSNIIESLCRETNGGTIPKTLLRKLATLVKPGMRTLELGCGLSTRAFDVLSSDHTAVEHNATWVNRLQPQLSKARIVLAELAPETPPRYEVDLEGRFDLVLVDGPPNVKGGNLRHGAVELLDGLLAPGATIIVDDTHRPGDRSLVAALCAKYQMQSERVREGARSFDILQLSPKELLPADLPCKHREVKKQRRVAICPQKNEGRSQGTLYGCLLLGAECVLQGVAVGTNNIPVATCRECPSREA